MEPDIWKVFEDVPYPAYFLGGEGVFTANRAAEGKGYPRDAQAVRRLMEALDRGMLQEGGPGAAEVMCGLMVMPVQGGLLAVGCGPEQARTRAYGTQMREPLTDLFAALPLLAAHLDEDGQRYIGQLQASGYKLLRLSNNIESFGQPAPEPAGGLPADLTSLVDTLCSCVQTVCGGQQVPLAWQLPPFPLPVLANARLLSDVLLNLIRNSLQFTRDGNHIVVRLERVNDQALLAVEDRGLGIKPEALPHIFTPFFSCDPYGDTAEKPGLGLGLAVVSQAAHMLGGTVKAQSRFGEGTGIYVALPLAPPGDVVLASQPAEYLLNRFSPVYIQLCGFSRLPDL